MKTVIRDIFLKYVLNIKKIDLIFIKIYYFYPKEIKLRNVISLFAAYTTKKKMLFT